MKTFTIQAIHATAKKRPPGYVEDVLAHGTVEGNKVTLSEEAYAALASKYRTRQPKAAKLLPPKVEEVGHGPGTELKALLKRVGIVAAPGCSCNTRAKLMDANELKEPGWCEKNLETICDWLHEEAAKRKLPFLRMAGKILVRKAIRNARKKRQLLPGGLLMSAQTETSHGSNPFP
jgi:hypothetical protein